MPADYHRKMNVSAQHLLEKSKDIFSEILVLIKETAAEKGSAPIRNAAQGHKRCPKAASRSSARFEHHTYLQLRLKTTTKNPWLLVSIGKGLFIALRKPC